MTTGGRKSATAPTWEDASYDSEGQIVNSVELCAAILANQHHRTQQVPTQYMVADEQIVAELFPIGTEVRGLFSNGLWYDAVIFDVEEQAKRYEIRWDDVDTRHVFKDLNQLVFRDGAPPVAQPAYYRYTYTGLIENHVMKLVGDSTYSGDKGGYTSYPTDQITGRLPPAPWTRSGTPSVGTAGPAAWSSGLHTYTCQPRKRPQLYARRQARPAQPEDLGGFSPPDHGSGGHPAPLRPPACPCAVRRVGNHQRPELGRFWPRTPAGVSNEQPQPTSPSRWRGPPPRLPAEQVSGVVAFTGSDGVPVPAVRARKEGSFCERLRRAAPRAPGDCRTRHLRSRVSSRHAYPDVYKTLQMRSGEDMKAFFGSVGRLRRRRGGD